MKIHAQRLLTPDGWLKDQTVSIEDGVISRIDKGSFDLSAEILVPGLIDLHNHGGEGFDISNCSLPLLERFLQRMLASGVTDFLMTFGTGNLETVKNGLSFIRSAMQLQKEGKLGGTRIAGVHMEGPFLNSKRPGAMRAEQIYTPEVEAFERLFGDYVDIIRLVTLAPEKDRDAALTAHLISKGIQVQAGHTDATFEESKESFSSGITSLCHTFNACRAIHHREPGIITAALLNNEIFCEAICDLGHLHPAAIMLIYVNKGWQRMMVVTDSSLPTGLPDGEYAVGDRRVIVKNGVKRTPSGALSGGNCYLDQSVRNLISIGIPAQDAFFMASETPARRMGWNNLGGIEPGKVAHLSAFTHQLDPDFTVLGENVYRR